MRSASERKNQSDARRAPLVIHASGFFFAAARNGEIPMDLKLEMAIRKHLALPFMAELQRSTKNIAPATYRQWVETTNTSCRSLLDKAEKENREITADEKMAFDEGTRLVDFWKQQLGEGRRESGRLVPPEPIFGAGNALKKTDRSRGTAHRYLTDDGQEVRALRANESFASANVRHDELPDGMQPEELSIGRWIRACITGDFSQAQAEKRAMGGSSDVGGGVLVPFALSSDFIDLARARTTVIQAGAQILPMESAQLRIAKLLTDAQPAWKAEGAIGSTSDATFGGVTLTSRTLIGISVVSKELAQDAPNFSYLIEHSLSEAIGLEIDRAALRGDGTNGSPIGIRNSLGINLVDHLPNGATPTYTDFSNAAKLILKANGIPRTAIYSTRTWGEFDLLVNTLGDSLRPPQSWMDLDKNVTSQIPENLTKGASNVASEAYVCDMEQLILGMRTNLTIEMSPVAGDSGISTFRSYQVAIRAVLRADVQLARPAHFTLIDGLL